MTQLLTTVLQDRVYFCISLPLTMPSSLPVALFGLPTTAWAMLPFISKNKERRWLPKLVPEERGHLSPKIPQQAWSPGSLPAPDATALARK